MKTFQVGFRKGLAGAPHPEVSLVRVVIKLEGGTDTMPWNASKSDVNYEHRTFIAIQGWLIEVVKDYAKLSRNWAGDWPNQVLRHNTGSVVRVESKEFVSNQKSYLPPAPVFRPRYPDRVRIENESIYDAKPYTRGLSDGVVAADLILRSRLAERNRIALVILDSTLEIAFKDYLVHASGKYYPDDKIVELFSQRHRVLEEVRKARKAEAFSDTFWEKVAYYYRLRCKLVHEKATAPISDVDIEDFRRMVEETLDALFGLSFSV